MQVKKVQYPLILLIITIIVVWVIFNNKPEARKSNGAPVHKLQTEVIEPQTSSYKVWVPSYGIVNPKTESLVIAQVSGQVISVSDQFRDGAFFEKGDELMVIDDADYNAQLSIAEAELKQAIFTHEDEKARSNLAVKEWYKLGNTKPPPSLVAREPQLNSSLSNLQASEAKVLQAKLSLKRTRIIAPFAGRVLNLDVNVGQVVSNGSTLGRIYAVDSVEIRLPLKQHDLQHLDLPEAYRDVVNSKKDKPITVKLMADIGNKTHLWHGFLARVEGNIDAQTRQLFVVVEVTDPYKFRDDGTPPLKIGQFVNALIEGAELQDVIVLPSASVSTSNLINVVEDGVLNRVPIDLLWQDDNEIVINNQFKKGQKISITPLGDVVSGTAVEIISDEPNEANDSMTNSKNKPTKNS